MLKMNPDRMTGIVKLETLYSRFCSDNTLLYKELVSEFGEDKAVAVEEELTKGVDSFYELYKSDIGVDELHNLLDKNMKDMDNLKKFSYLSNLILALNSVNNKVMENDEQNDILNENEIISAAIENGMLDNDSLEIQSAIDSMMSLIERDVDHFAVLFTGTPPYESLLDACETDDLETIKALAANTRQSAVNMAAAMAILNHRGEAGFAEKDTVHPQDLGVVAASSLEMDAAQKSNNKDEALSLVEKIARTACMLLVASPHIIGDMSAWALIAVLSGFSGFWMVISGAVLLINLRVHMNNLKEHMEPVFNIGAKILSVPLSLVKGTAVHIGDWIQSTVIPAAIPVWEEVRKFTVDRIIVPATAFLLKAKSIAESLMQKAQEVWRNLKEKIGDEVDTVIYRAQAETDAHATVDDMDENVGVFDNTEDSVSVNC